MQNFCTDTRRMLTLKAKIAYHILIRFLISFITLQTVNVKAAMYPYIGENQMQLPGYIEQYIRKSLTVPQEGFWKGYRSKGVDFLTARGHISFNATRHIGLQLGHGKHFIGNGYRSLVQSDFANNYLFFRINTHVWKLHYTNMRCRWE